MGWEFHITRADDWSESAEKPISAAEWLAVVAEDPELHIDEDNGPYFAVWSGPCTYPDGGWFDWADGFISTKNPDSAILGKMLRLAVKLRASVQDDEGDVFTDAAQISNTQSSQRPWLTWADVVAHAKVGILLLLLGCVLLALVLWIGGV
jgi:hypothetical protein